MANLIRVMVPKVNTDGSPRHDRVLIPHLDGQTRIESRSAKFLDKHYPQAVTLGFHRTENMQDRRDREWTMG
jgi:hypothetical protein